MAPRAIWKGQLQISELVCPVSLHAAASTAGRVSFHLVNRATGNRVRREYVDAETGEQVEREQQVKGYATDDRRYIPIEPEEYAAALPENHKTLQVEAFLDCADIDTVYLDRPYFLLPAEPTAEEAFTVIREGLRARRKAAVARAMLFRRVRSLLIRAQGRGLIASTLRFDYEVRPAEEAFAGIHEQAIQGEMLDLARHIIASKRGEFDPAAYDDRYDAALAGLVKAKAAGRKIRPRGRRPEGRVIDLMDALRKSAEGAGPASRREAASRNRKAG
ncbi:MAG: Ku protein [Geminicoccaceae bacterium]|nr:Ku protein [Geminicoccaceae bacterium]HRY24478.1 Ku protein [Geminicoccaceae bacterium]